MASWAVSVESPQNAELGLTSFPHASLSLCSRPGRVSRCPREKTRAHLDADADGSGCTWIVCPHGQQPLCSCYRTSEPAAGALQPWPLQRTPGLMGKHRAVTSHLGKRCDGGHVGRSTERGFLEGRALGGPGECYESAPVAIETHSCWMNPLN